MMQTTKADFSADLTKLFNAARMIKDNAWAHYTGHAVSTAIMGSNNRIYLGVNLESAVVSEGLSASRVAFGNMIIGGARGFRSWLLLNSGEEICLPAGGDLQIASEFADSESEVVCCNESGSQVEIYRFIDLMPHAFKASNMVRRR